MQTLWSVTLGCTYLGSLVKPTKAAIASISSYNLVQGANASAKRDSSFWLAF